VYIWQAQDNEFVLNFLELMALEHLATIIITIIEQMLSKEGFIGIQRDDKYFGIGRSVNLFLYQLLTFIHSFFAPTICKQRMNLEV
jgi:hypothetical protein